jgi:hypothetical protein
VRGSVHRVPAVELAEPRYSLIGQGQLSDAERVRLGSDLNEPAAYEIDQGGKHETR